MIKTFALLPLVFTSVCYASTSSLVVSSARDLTFSSVTLSLPADYVVAPISITSDDKEPSRSMEAIQGVKALIMEAAKKDGNITLRLGNQSLSVSAREGGGFSSSSSSWVTAPSQVEAYIAVRLSKEKTTSQATKEIISFLRGLPKPDQVHVRVGNTSLGIEDPAQYRPRLISLIAKEVENTRSALGNTKTYELSGLESPVMVTQQDDQNVLLFIPFHLKIGQ